MNMKYIYRVLKIMTVCLFVTILFLTSKVFSQSSDKVENLFESLNWRCIGPAAVGGRTVDIDVVKEKPWIIYAAIGPSGVWKSENNGTDWNPVFDKEKTVSAGDVTIAPSHPEIVWVGTGESTCRNSVTIGNGVYKSVDGGKSWENKGLNNTRHISRIIINPGDPNILFVAAMGHLWGPNKERGVYKTIDGGKTWKNVLYINENTGIADMAMDPSDSLTLYAAAYDHRRLPYYFRSGGPGSGLYKTADGGKTWKKLEKDLPEGVMGRIGIAVSHSNPDVIYALIEHKNGGIWRSENKGESWERTCDNETYQTVNSRPFYYSQIRVDPTDDNVIYVFSGGLFVSRDMGKRFKSISGNTHPDHHALWIDPSNPLHLVDGNDGGIDISYDGGKTWRNIQHMTLAEVYQIGFDYRTPYYVYCGLQDNGSWGGPSATFDNSGILNSDWYRIGGGDGFYIQVDPLDNNIVYNNFQMNALYRVNLKTGHGQSIRPETSLKKPPFRYNWNSPILTSHHDPKTLYTGGNFLFKTTDGGHSWTKISPDLSTNDPEKQKDSGGPITPDNTGAEIHCTIITIAESPVKKGVIWCGTDDGNVQLTLDGGKNWSNVVNNIKGLPPHTWCSRIEASHFDAGTAYAAFDGHRNDDYNTYLYKTENYGKTWKSIKGNLPFGWIHVIREDTRNPNLLFSGTEFGIFASLDGGESWFSLKNNLPTVAVRDIAIHPRENDLIIGTHGRGVWIMDNIYPLQEMNTHVIESDVHLFNIKPVTHYYRSSRHETSTASIYSAANPEGGMIIDAYFKEKPKERPCIFIKDKSGDKVYEIRLPTKTGLFRKEWNFQMIPKTKDGKIISTSAFGLVSVPLVSPGEYRIELKIDEQSLSKKGIIHSDPRIQFDKDAWEDQVEAQIETMVLSRKMGLAITAVKSIKMKLKNLHETLEEKEKTKAQVEPVLNQFEEKFNQLSEEIIPKEIGYRGSAEMALRGIMGSSYSMMVRMLGMSLGGPPLKPTNTDLFKIKELKQIIGNLVDKLNALIKKDIPELNLILSDYGLKKIRPPKEIKI